VLPQATRRSWLESTTRHVVNVRVKADSLGLSRTPTTAVPDAQAAPLTTAHTLSIDDCPTGGRYRATSGSRSHR
jgi:hypothetical protein